MNGKIVTKKCLTPISTIVYITDRKILDDCLASLTRAMKVEYLYCIHKGENGDKDHTHLLLYSLAENGFNCVEKIRNYFLIDEKPTYCSNFQQTKSLGDWYKYAYHDKDYLDGKKEIREYYYTENDVIGSDNLRSLCLDNYKYQEQRENASYLAQIYDGLANGLTDLEIIEKMPLSSVTDYVQALRLIDEVKKRVKKNDTDQYVQLLDLLNRYILNNNASAQDFDVKFTASRTIANRITLAELALKMLAQIDVLDLVRCYDE